MKEKRTVQLWEVTPSLTSPSLEGSKVLKKIKKNKHLRYPYITFLGNPLILQRDFAVKLPLIQKLIHAMSLKWQLKSIQSMVRKYFAKTFVLFNFNWLLQPDLD